MKKRLLAALLATCMLLSLPVTFAADSSSSSSAVTSVEEAEEKAAEAEQTTEKKKASSAEQSGEAAPVEQDSGAEASAEASTAAETSAEAPAESSAQSAESPAESSSSAETAPAEESGDATDPADTPASVAGKRTACGSDYKVTVSYGSDACIPENAEVHVSEYKQSSAHYASAVRKAEKLCGEELTYARLFDVSILVDGKEIEPQAPVSVSISLNDPITVAEDGEIKIVHFAESGAEVLSAKTDGTEYKETSNVERITFKTRSFSDILAGGVNAYQAQEVNVDDLVALADETAATTSLNAKEDTVNGANLGKVSISYGKFADTAANAKQDYDFVEAWYDGKIKITGVYQKGSATYVTVEGNSVSAIVADTSKITLVYRAKDSYPVTYKVTVNGTEVTDIANYVTLVGVSTVKQNETKNFSVTPVEGYTIGSVTATGATVDGSDGTYTISNASGAVTVTIPLTEKTTYNFTFNGSNTTLIDWNNGSHNSNANQSGSVWSGTYTADNTLNFSLTGRNEWSSNAKILNQLSITIDNTQYSIGIPDSVGADNAVTTTLENGYKVTVTKTNEVQYPTYTVSIQAPEGKKVRGDIHVQTNFKDYNTSEVWAKQLDGTEPLAYQQGSGYNSKFVKVDGQGDQNSRLQPEVYTFQSRNTSYATTYYVKLNGDYPAEDLYLTVENWKATQQTSGSWWSQTTTYPVSYVGTVNGYDDTKVSTLTQVTGTELAQLANSSSGNYTTDDTVYKFTIPAGTSYVDLRIYIRYKAPEGNYTIWWDPNDETTATFQSPTQGLGTGAKFIVPDLPNKTYTDEAGETHTFEGWTLTVNGKETTYTVDQLVELNDALTQCADEGNKITFKAKWSSTAYKSYKVAVYFMDENGDYSENPDYTLDEKGAAGESIYLLTDDLENKITEEKNDDGEWKNTYTFDKKEGDTTINEDGSSVVKVYYKRCKANVVVYKHDSTDEEMKLSGAEFTLKNSEGKYYSVGNDGTVTWSGTKQTLTTGTDGKTNTVALYDGTYTLTETKAPDGYNLLSDGITLTIQNGAATSDTSGVTVATETAEDGSVTYVVKVSNTAGSRMPNTGGAGTSLSLLMAGTALMGAVFIGYSVKRRYEAE